MRRAISVKLSSENDHMTMIVPGELSFEELSTIIDEAFDVDSDDHAFISERSDERIGPNYMACNSDECHRYLSAYPRYPIEYVIDDEEVISMRISWTKKTDRDCPFITESSFSEERNRELNDWFEREFYLLAEVDGNPYGKRTVYRDELTEEVAKALRSEERLDFYLDIDSDCLAVIADDHDEYECITEEDVEEYDDALILIREADDILVYKAASEFSGTAVCDHDSYKGFDGRVENIDDWTDYLDRKIREAEREWVRKNDLWIDICDLDALLGDIRLF